MPKVTEAHLAARRRQILDAAIACFARKGFHETTMQDIGQEAGLSQGAAYRYFASKEEIVEACCQECQEIGSSMIDEAIRNGDPVEVIDYLVDAAFSELCEPQAHTVSQVEVQMWCEAIHNSRIMASLRNVTDDLWRATLVGLITRAQEMGRIGRQIDPDAAARVMISWRQGLVLQIALDPSVDVPAYVRGLKDALGGMFTAPPMSNGGSYRHPPGEFTGP